MTKLIIFTECKRNSSLEFNKEKQKKYLKSNLPNVSACFFLPPHFHLDCAKR